jgi:hypothetical protein
VPWSILALLVLLAIGTVASTHRTFSPTWDEPAHIVTGLELLQHGRYELEPLHPPLARLAAAIGPAALGARFQQANGIWDSARRTLYGHPRHQELVIAARRGALAFLALTILATVLWANALAGAWGALGAGFLLLTTPAILGHAGLATTDMALTGAVTLALWSFVRWLERPGLARGALLGFAIGVAVMSKYSAVPLLGLSFLTIAVVRGRAQTGARGVAAEHRPAIKYSVVASGTMAAAVVFLAVAWVSHAPALAHKDAVISAGSPASTASPSEELGGMPVFVRSIATGIADVIEKNRGGHAGYFLGEFSGHSSPFFFPVALAVKTPLPLGLLGLCSLVWAIVRLRTRGDWRYAAPAVAFLVILLLACTARINIGLRHVLPLYPLLVILAAVAMVRVVPTITRTKPAMLAVFCTLLGWQAATALKAYPDYLAYFNPLAGEAPERILIGSDLDWGQDLYRLAQGLEEHDVACLTLLYSGSADPTYYGLPPVRTFDPRHERPSGWVAVSLLARERYRRHLDWLLEATPRFRAGVSIDVYHLGPDGNGCLSAAAAEG